MGQEPGASSAPVTEPRDPAEIRQDIETTRHELGETVEALAHKADVKAQAKAKVDEVKGRLGDKRAESSERFKRATPDSAGQAASTVATKARENRTPLIVAAAYGAGAGALALTGKTKVQQATPPVPEEATESVKEDVRWAKSRAQAARK